MTPQQNKLWNLWVIAEGIATLMKYWEVNEYNIYCRCGNELPFGICILISNITNSTLLINDFPELIKPKGAGAYWFPEGDWRPRADLILKAMMNE